MRFTPHSAFVIPLSMGCFAGGVLAKASRSRPVIEWWVQDSNLRRQSHLIYSQTRLTASVTHRNRF